MKDKIEHFFSNFSLTLSEKYPFDSKSYLYADYFELVALFNKGSFITVGDMLDRLNDEGILNQSTDVSDQAEQNDDEEFFVRGIFEILNQRQDLFGNDYPFKYLKETIIINDGLNNKQRTYIFLLISSNLNLFSDFQANLTNEFELLSLEALKNYLPTFAITKSFGKNNDFKGYTFDKIQQLAKIMNLEPDEFYLNTISKKGTQDLGLDIAGWIPFFDNVGNYISVFGQCACGKNWTSKLNETRRYNNFLKVYHSNIKHSIFIPYALINNNNNSFFEHHEFGTDILVFERKRVLSLIKNEEVFENFESALLVDSCLEFVENIV
ncbi:hypothetical protein [Winogradskyella pulchriflava]|uniref:Restriction endonuclease n=1 Tax=Winogradskyella pulchriflava TaxID=1110688 RepID=A0ABV6Q9F1_9FLAO